MKNIQKVLKQGGLFGIYDVMQIFDGEIFYPLPCAETAESSAVTTLETYKNALTSAGFPIISERQWRDFAVKVFENMISKIGSTGGLPPLGLHLLMGGNSK